MSPGTKKAAGEARCGVGVELCSVWRLDVLWRGEWGWSGNLNEREEPRQSTPLMQLPNEPADAPRPRYVRRCPMRALVADAQAYFESLHPDIGKAIAKRPNSIRIP